MTVTPQRAAEAEAFQPEPFEAEAFQPEPFQPEPFQPGVEDIAGILEEVWTSFLGESPVAVPAGMLPLEGDRVTALVSVTGAWDGHVAIECPAGVATSVAAALMQVEEAEVEPDDVSDAVGELVNMVGGYVKSLAPAPSALSLPLVLRGAESSTSAPNTVEICRADVVWRDEPVVVTVLAAAGNTTEGTRP